MIDSRLDSYTARVRSYQGAPANCNPANGDIINIVSGGSNGAGLYTPVGQNKWGKINTDSIFNVLSFGAVGDGVADDTTAIQKALDAAKGSGGGLVYLPDGNYKISSTLKISGNDVCMASSSANAILSFTAALGNNPGILVKADVAGTIIFRNRFKGFQITLTNDLSTGISFNCPNYFQIDEVEITGTNTGAANQQTAINIDGTGFFAGLGSIQRSVTYYTKFGIKLGANCNAIQIIGNLINGLSGAPAGSVGFTTFDATNTGNLVIGNDFEGWAEGISDSGLRTQIIGNRFENNTHDITHVYPGSDGFYNVGNLLDVSKCAFTLTSGTFRNYGGALIEGSQNSFSESYLAGVHGSVFGIYTTSQSANATFKIQGANSGLGLFGQNVTGNFQLDIATPYPFNIGTTAGSVFSIWTNSVSRFSIDAAGLLKIITLPPIYANNAAALAGGLTAGNIYRNGADPDHLCIVH